MRLSEICIERPVLATVMSLVIVLFGAIALDRLPNRELPDIDPPVVSVTTIYPGAAPEVVETSVTEPLEDQLIGIDGVKHLTSKSREQVSEITVEFELGRDLEAAANDVRDRVARSRGALPEEVEDPLVAKRDSDASAIMWIALSGSSRTMLELTQLVESHIKDRLSKLLGVSAVIIGGERRYAMRIWIDNAQLTARRLTIADVASALERENVDLPSGRMEGPDVEYTVRSLGELRTAEGYGALTIAVRNGDPIRLRDVARVEVGPEDERKIVRFNGRPAVGLGVVKQSKANTLDVADRVQAELARIRPTLPQGVVLEVAWDGSEFIRESISDVTRTIFEAVLLVIFVIYLFLRSARATLVPAIAIPVSIVGTFAILYFLGFTINTLTLMGVTLAIGLVVDDAIVVLENIARWVESGVPAREAAIRGMREISFAVVAATVSAVAVFAPLTFLTDTTGRLFREFGVTVAAALAISGFVALTLSPALCALILRRHGKDHGLKATLERGFDALARGYARLLGFMLHHRLTVFAVSTVWVAVGVYLYQTIDEELVTSNDRSTVMAFTQAPEGSTLEYTNRYQLQAEAVAQALPETRRVFSVVSLGLDTPGLVNEGFLWIPLKPPEERERSQSEIAEALFAPFSAIAGISVFPFEPSPMRTFRGAPVEFVIQGPDVAELKRLATTLTGELMSTGGFSQMRDDLFLNKPQLEVRIDRDRAGDLGVSVRDVATTLQILLGGVDLSTFKLAGETYDVVAQLPRGERSRTIDMMGLYVRGKNDQLIPMASVVDARETVAPRALSHFDRRRSVKVQSRLGSFAQGEALAEVQRAADAILDVGRGYQLSFVGESERFFESSGSLAFAYVLAIVVVFLVLAAQFESFVDPFTILVAVALSFTGALVALFASDMTLNLYSKIGLVMLVGLVTKNSILIVEFANQLREAGKDAREAIFEAARTRFRPILMTAIATIAGIAPIALGAGAGGETRAPLGVAVVGGMFFSTVLTIFAVPATYLAVDGLRRRLRGRSAPAVAATPPRELGAV
ncbi:MAG: efflux RND transporter permease subunit [Myxococcales bacterium]|nr:efflux RND transporter permease subunit [Myxococcales bacterium]